MIDFESAPDETPKKRPASQWGSEFRVPPAKAASGAPPEYINALNDRQREAALITEGPLIVLAGAGSGKTKMLTARIAYLMDHCQVAPHQILAVTFTNKAAGEMKERVQGFLGGDFNSYFGGLATPEIGTFHSICVRILRREMGHTPFTKPFVIYDDSDQLSLLKGVMKKLDIDDKRYNPKAFQGAINRAKCDALEPHELFSGAPGALAEGSKDAFARNLERVYTQYQKDLFANNALDFGEILCMVYRLFRDHPEVRQRYQQRFRYVHVDEYQDTNRAQYLLLSMIAKKEFGGHENICVVGDEDQSIYKWRGADIRNILDFEDDYPGAHIVKLEQNYRSTKTIITAASQVISNNTQRKEKTLWTDNEEGLPIYRAQLPDERAEAELVVSEIKRLAQYEDRTFNEFSIFYRTHAQSRQFEDVLRRENIPYQIVGGLRFYDRKEIKDILSYFKAVLNPTDSVSLKRIINVPARGIGKTTIDRIEEFQLGMEAGAGESITYWDALQKAAAGEAAISSGPARKVKSFVDLLQKLISEQPKLLLSELYHLILDETQYVQQLKKEGTDESLARIENLEEFDNLLTEFEEETLEATPEEQRDVKKTELLSLFVEQSTLMSEADTNSGLLSAVKMMTLHSSKGLEFPVVFLPGMEEGLFPSVRDWENSKEEDIEEERRLCYVGMTRAREMLYLLNAVVRRIWGNIHYQDPSRFFAEMPEELIDFKDFSYGNAANRYQTGTSRHLGFNRQGGAQARSASPPQRKSGFSDFDFDQTPRYAGTQNHDLVGQKINHPDYGFGTIIAVDTTGSDQRVTLEFSGRTQRKFLWRFIENYLEGN